MRLLSKGAVLAAWVLMTGPAAALDIVAAVLRVDYQELLPISRLDQKPADYGFAGALLADQDNGTTGRFLGMNFETRTLAVPPEEVEAAVGRLRAEGIGLIVMVADGAEVLRAAEAAGPDALVINGTARETSLRSENCRGNLLHVAPSHAMLADAVMQFAMWKKWRDIFLVFGSHPADRALADAYRRAAAKFGARITDELLYEDQGGSNRTDTGHVLVQRQIPVLTQDADDYDVAIAADESEVFAAYLNYNTWEPRPVMGSGGLRPVTMHPAFEAWGATQLQNRFEEATGRLIMEADYEVWLALRVIGEAVIRVNTAEPAALRDYAMSESFELAAFKGQKVTFRPWNGQLRQPVILYDGHITISVSPQDGYLHQVSPLDTLGLDRPESGCTAFE